jgi:hypothetical protein
VTSKPEVAIQAIILFTDCSAGYPPGRRVMNDPWELLEVDRSRGKLDKGKAGTEGVNCIPVWLT